MDEVYWIGVSPASPLLTAQSGTGLPPGGEKIVSELGAASATQADGGKGVSRPFLQLKETKWNYFWL